jgi:hypothetical protein
MLFTAGLLVTFLFRGATGVILVPTQMRERMHTEAHPHRNWKPLQKAEDVATGL